MQNTLKNLNVELSQTQAGMVDKLTETNPIIASIPVKAASHGFYNLYPTVSEITGMQDVDYDDELPTVGISFELGQTPLGKIGGKLPIPKDAAQAIGGYSKYADSRLPKIIAKSGNDQEFKIYYNGFMKSAIKNGTLISAGGTSANKQYSIAAVTWDEDSTVGLYNPNTLSDGKLFEQIILNNGAEYELDVNGRKFIGKMIASYMQFGLQLADPRLVGVIANIEPKTNSTDKDKIDGLPTADMLDDLLAGVRAGSNTALYCHPALANKLANKFNLKQRSVGNGETGVRYALFDWQGVPVISSYNLSWGKEAVVTVE